MVCVLCLYGGRGWGSWCRPLVVIRDGLVILIPNRYTVGRPATMAAVRCAARRLGGSLLQRTQAAVAEEGRLLAPSRLMRSRQLSTKVSGEVSYPKLTSLFFRIMITASRLDVGSHNRILCNRNSNIY